MALDFYHGHGSPFSWRVHLALEHKKIPYTLKVLSFQNQDTKKPEFTAINPRGQVPTIVDDGHALWESTVIVEYLEERFASGDKLFPGDARERARIRRLAREAEEYVYKEGVGPITDEYFWKGDVPPDEKVVAQRRDKVAQELNSLASELRGDYFGGGVPSAADFTLYPYVAFCKRITFRKPESKLTEAVPPKIADWAKRIESQPYFDKTYPPHWR
jgi:glutathione S-transferase